MKLPCHVVRSRPHFSARISLRDFDALHRGDKKAFRARPEDETLRVGSVLRVECRSTKRTCLLLVTYVENEGPLPSGIQVLSVERIYIKKEKPCTESR